jgi:hypothetical protein
MSFNPLSQRRRHFLRGVGGALLALPFLESLAPRKARAQEGAIKRFGVFFCCNGVNMERWFPNGDFGALSDAHLEGTANAALIPYRDKLLYPRGVHMTPRGFGRDPGGGDDHGKGMAHKLTAPNGRRRGLARARRVRRSRDRRGREPGHRRGASSAADVARWAYR